MMMHCWRRHRHADNVNHSRNDAGEKLGLDTVRREHCFLACIERGGHLRMATCRVLSALRLHLAVEESNVRIAKITTASALARTVAEILREMNCKPCKSDPNVYVHESGELYVHASLHERPLSMDVMCSLCPG